MDADIGTVLTAVACTSAAVSGFCAWRVRDERAQRNRQRRALAEAGENGAASMERWGARGSNGLQARVLAYAERTSQGIDLGCVRCLLPRAPAVPERFERMVALAGSRDSLTYEGYRESRVRLAGIGCIIGAAAGLLFSTEMAVAMALLGGLLGWRMLPSALKARIAQRSDELERRLPEMLDVLALGMRSGLSFDGSLALYEKHFDTALARAFCNAQRQWSCGLLPRDEALRAIAKTYDSFLFKRVMDNILRSLRFGTSLANGLEDVAREARAEHKAHRQEQVAKVPIKMMLPTGALMLPAMLILVLGPVLLELAGNI